MLIDGGKQGSAAGKNLVFVWVIAIARHSACRLEIEHVVLKHVDSARLCGVAAQKLWLPLLSDVLHDGQCLS